MTLILATKAAACSAIVLVLMMIFFYTSARTERGDAVGNYGALAIICFLLLVIAVLILLGCVILLWVWGA